MKRTTKKLSGVGLQLFLERFYAGYTTIDDASAGQLVKDGCRTFASVRVRRTAWHEASRRRTGPLAVAATPAARPEVIERAGEASAPPAVPASALEGGDAIPKGAFDPYAIGLIPTYQREGPDGLLVKLKNVTSVENLRKMARSQQLSLPADLRHADAPIDEVRGGIVAAVGKRIADRRAAAG